MKMTKWTAVLAAVMMVCLPLAFLGCKNNSEDTPVYRTVSFDSDGGSEVEAQSVLDGEKATRPADPTKTGYTFTGWFKGTESSAFDFDSAITNDVSLKARWTTNTYTVTFVTGEGASDPTPATATVTYGHKLLDLESVPSKTGLTFGGYYTETLAEGTKFIDKDGNGCAEWNITSNATLYAAFGYTITYNNTKNVANTNPDVYIEGKGLASLSAIDGTTIGYNNMYWSESSGGSVVMDNPVISADATGSKTFYAVWSDPIEYTITYDVESLSGVTLPDEYKTSYTVEDPTFPLTSVELDNPNLYSFGGWYDTPTSENRESYIYQGSIGNKTFYGRILLGKKANPNAVGDIVFNNGRAVAYSESLIMDEDAKSKAIAVIFYKGSECNNIGSATRILGIGLKNTKCSWCLDSAKAFNINIQSIQCEVTGSKHPYSYSGNKDGSDHWEKIENTNGVDDTATEANYPAFYFAKNYSSIATNLGDTYKDGWYLPTIAELNQMYNNYTNYSKAALLCGGGTPYKPSYLSSTQRQADAKDVWYMSLANGIPTNINKDKSINDVCCIRQFN